LNNERKRIAGLSAIISPVLDAGGLPEGDLERLNNSRYRMHGARRYTIFPGYEGNDTTVLKIMTIEQAHMRYGRI